MTEERFSRSEALLGEGATERLRGRHVAVFGLGGVGSYLVEALARMGVGHLTLIDKDVYTESNLNRQLYALPSTLGRKKTEVAAERVAAIDPAIEVTTCDTFVLPETLASLPIEGADYLADAIDTVSAKIALALYAKENNVPVLSAMGAGNKLDPTAFRIADIEKTKGCPLARVIRTELKKRGGCPLKVVYSEETPAKSKLIDAESGKPAPASCSFVPSVVGLIMAGEIIKDLLK
ncbi:MAG: tRNA threonylcarbamoyladenosine dehydratase [Clostridia bacterium]|nr:tRNA threonylcarbamoyladenosine dehydratase [Clostridia bacterium]